MSHGWHMHMHMDAAGLLCNSNRTCLVFTWVSAWSQHFGQHAGCMPNCILPICVPVQLLRSGPDSPLHSAPLWARAGLAGGRCCDAALVREFRREARVVREGMEGDLIKVCVCVCVAVSFLRVVALRM